MCGIFAAISLIEPFNQVDYKVFKDATDLVSHRGPDDSGYKIFKFSEKLPADSFNLFFGHRRLSIIDLSSYGHQPMEDSGNIIIYNGEIFNYIELREELKNYNHHFETNSDTEVILKLYKHYGPAGFEKLNGMWAFIIYDSNKNQLIASRDRFSIKPLFWSKIGNKIFFASEIKQLIKLLPSKKINLQTLNLFMLQGLLDIDTSTFFEGIEKLEPKQNLIVDLSSGNIRKQKYWDYNINELNGKDISEQFLELLYDSVKIRLRSDVKIGALLSGGLDSSAISMISSNISGDSFQTYSVITDNKKYSEERFVDIIVNEKKIKNEKLYVSADTIRENFSDVIRYQDEPFTNFVVLAHYTILKKIKNETDLIVVLSGQGGDEVLLGYMRFFYFYLKNLYSNKNYYRLFSEIFASLFFRTVISQWRLSAAKRYIPQIIKNEKRFLLMKPELKNTWDFNNLTSSQIEDIDKYSVPILTRYEDRNSMAHSLEIRLPFLDHRLVEFLLSLDVEFKIKNGWNKYILRKSFSDMPSKIRWRRDKKGFSLPEGQWLKKDFRVDILDRFKNSYLEQLGIIRGDFFLKYFESYVSGNRKIHSFDISRVYITERWLNYVMNN